MTAAAFVYILFVFLFLFSTELRPSVIAYHVSSILPLSVIYLLFLLSLGIPFRLCGHSTCLLWVVYTFYFMCTRAIRGTKPCPLEVVYTCLQQSSKSAIVA